MSQDDRTPLVNCDSVDALSNEEKTPTPQTITAGEKFTFGFLGFTAFVSALTSYQLFLAVKHEVFPRFNYPLHAQNALSNGQLLMTTLLLVLGRNVDPLKSVTRGLMAQLGVNIAFPLVFLFGRDSEIFYSIQMALMFTQQALLGLILNGAFSLAGILSDVLNVWLSAGVPISGLVPFVIHCIISNYISEYSLLFVMSPIPIFSVIACLILLSCMVRRPWIHDKILKMRRECKYDTARSTDVEFQKVESGSMTPWQVFVAAIQPISASFLGMMLLFTIYPAYIGSLRPGPPRFAATIIGVQTVGETIGRWLVLGGLRLPRWALVPVAVLRFAFIPIFASTQALDISQWARSELVLYSLMTVQALSFGSLMASSQVDAPACVKNLSDKHLTGILSSTAANYGLLSGTLLLNILISLRLLPSP